MRLSQDRKACSFPKPVTGSSGIGFMRSPNQSRLGFRNTCKHLQTGILTGQPPQDYEARLGAYAKHQPGGALTLGARAFLAALARKGQQPGWSNEERGWMSFGMTEQVF